MARRTNYGFEKRKKEKKKREKADKKRERRLAKARGDDPDTVYDEDGNPILPAEGEGEAAEGTDAPQVAEDGPSVAGEVPRPAVD